MSDDKRKGPGPDESEPLEFLNRDDQGFDDEFEENDYPLGGSDKSDEPAAPPPPLDPDDDDVDAPMTAAPPSPASESEYDDDEERDDGDAVPPVTATRRSVRGRGNGDLSRIMIGAGVVIVAAALFIFWPRGGGLPTEEGDLTSVVTLPDTSAAAVAAVPRSSDVDLDQELQDVVPEKPDIGDPTPEGARVSLRQEADSRPQADEAPADPASPVTQGTAPATKADQQPAVTLGDPSAQGKWVVQMGAFGTAGNAAKVADTYSGQGFRCEVVNMPSTNGGSTYKVWIGYFETRAAATAYARDHRETLGTNTYITHR